MIPFRVWVIPKWFSAFELGILDGLTASNSAVLVSLGGQPVLVENRRNAAEDGGVAG